VVVGEHADVLLRPEAEQARAKQRASRQIETTLLLLFGDSGRFLFARRQWQACQIGPGQRNGAAFGNNLGRTVFDDGEGRSQNVVAGDDLVERTPESVFVQDSLETKRARNVVNGALGRQMVEEPEPLLRERERRRLRIRPPRNRRRPTDLLPALPQPALEELTLGG
jgi:hypothetical protein